MSDELWETIKPLLQDKPLKLKEKSARAYPTWRRWPTSSSS